MHQYGYRSISGLRSSRVILAVGNHGKVKRTSESPKVIGHRVALACPLSVLIIASGIDWGIKRDDQWVLHLAK